MPSNSNEMNKNDLLLITGTLFAGILAFLLFYRRGRKFPPGPTGLPLIGNVFDWPQTQAWVTFKAMGDKYGGMVYLNVLGKPIIILNDAKYAGEMLDKKSRLYSDRPLLMMAGQIVGWDQGPALSPFGERWSEYRRLLAQFMGSKTKTAAFGNVFQQECVTYLQSILANSTDWVEHTRRFAGAVVLMVAYGYKANDSHDELVKLVDTAMNQFSETTAPNAFMVDILPILRFAPMWMPGAGWKRKAFLYRETLQEMLDRPYAWVKQQMLAGSERSCFVSQALTDRQPTPEQEYIIKWTAGGIYSGGAETTVAGIECFVLAMVLQTSAQQKAQAEIDRVLGVGVLPTLADRMRLPYVEALYMETLRKYTFAPVGLPHVVSNDDVHDGHFIPKGSMVIANVWQFFQDPKTYPDPYVFSPERFLGSGSKQKDPRDYLFGFGRRQCPGIHFADASMWLACASLLTVFDIQPVTKDGQPHLPTEKYMDGSISHPESFDCVISPRRSVTATKQMLNIEN